MVKFPLRASTSKNKKPYSKTKDETSTRLSSQLKKTSDAIQEIVHDVDKTWKPEETVEIVGNAYRIKGSRMDVDIVSLPPANLPPGFTVTPIPTPILLGGFPNGMFDPQEWAKKLNDKLAACKLDYLPNFPFVTLVMGGINTGKTNMIATLSTFYISYAEVQNLTIISQTADTDPTYTTLKHQSAPHTKIDLLREVPIELMEKDYHAISSEFGPLLRTGSVNKYKTQEIMEGIVDLQLPSSIHHPRTDPDGAVRSFGVKIPDHLQETSEKNDALLPFYCRTKKGVSDDLDHYLPTSNMKKLADKPDKYVPSASCGLEHWVLQANLNPMADVLANQRENIAIRGRQGYTHLREKKFENRVLVFDDPAKYLRRGGNAMESYVSTWITELRHRHHSVIFGIQKTTMVPPVIRGQATCVFMWRSRSKTEMKWFIEEYGSRVPNFEELYEWAMMPTPSLPRPFLIIRLDTVPARIFRGFEHEIMWSETTSTTIESKPLAKTKKASPVFTTVALSSSSK